jgi:ketosteroid isomerase-like protein
MATSELVATRASDYFRLIDAKDEAGLRAMFSGHPQHADEITRGWLRGRQAVLACLADTFPHITDIHSTIEDIEVRRWGDVEVETFMLRQSYVYDGTPYAIEAPTTMIWRREGDAWKVALGHSIPLSPVS